jgi:hypothetical protein
MTPNKPIKKIKLLAAAGALTVSFLFSGCSAIMDLGEKAPELQPNAQSFKMYDSDKIDSMLIDVNGRTYAPYGVVKNSMSKSSLRDCLGYVDDDKNCRIYTLNEDPFDNYLIQKSVNAFMDPDMFWRDISTIEEDIFTPEYIQSQDYEEWSKSGAYSEMKSFKFNVTIDSDDVKEIIMDYTINGDVQATGGVRNADYSVIKKGEMLEMEIVECSIYRKYDKNAPFNLEVEFSVLTKDGDTVKVDGMYKGTVVFGASENLTLTGNSKDGYKIGG